MASIDKDAILTADVMNATERDSLDSIDVGQWQKLSNLPKISEVSVSRSRMLSQSHISDSGEPSEEDWAEAAIDCHIPAMVNSTNPKLGPAMGGVDLVS